MRKKDENDPKPVEIICETLTNDTAIATAQAVIAKEQFPEVKAKMGTRVNFEKINSRIAFISSDEICFQRKNASKWEDGVDGLGNKTRRIKLSVDGTKTIQVGSNSYVLSNITEYYELYAYTGGKKVSFSHYYLGNRDATGNVYHADISGGDIVSAD